MLFRSKHIRSFMSEFIMTLCNELIAPNYNYTYHHPTLKSGVVISVIIGVNKCNYRSKCNHWSFVDYFMISSNIVNELLKF